MAPVSEETVVIGAGAIGLSVAYWLAESGEPVRVVDRSPIGRGASFANGGWINRSDAVPLSAPDSARYVLSKLGRADSPLYVRPTVDLTQLLWLLRFLVHCRRRAYERGAAALTRLAEPAAELYSELEGRADFRFEQRGHLHVFTDPERIKYSLRGASTVKRYGYDPGHQVLDRDQLRALEPALGDRVRGGVLFPHEAHVDPSEFTAALAARLKDMGVTIATDFDICGFESAHGGVTACVAADGRRVKAGRVVLAAGSGTTRLAKAIGERIPVRAGKGYSFSLRLPRAVQHTILLGDSKVGLTPLGARVRVLGTMEFSDERSVVRPRRIAPMLSAARTYLRDVPPDASAEELSDAWVGLRPMSVDGLPIIDRCRSQANAYVVTAHGMLGMMLGPSTGKAMADFVRHDRRPPVLEPFRIDRFGPRALARGRRLDLSVAPRPEAIELGQE